MNWVIFFTITGILIALDLFTSSSKREPSLKESIIRSLFFVGCGVAFGVWTWLTYGHDRGAQFFTGYLLELSLSFDNIFVISVIFATLSIPKEHRHNVLFWGILGALVMRGIFIAAGVAIVETFSWTLILFGAFLLYTGIKMFFMEDKSDMVDIEKNPILRWMRRYVPITENLHGSKFFYTKYEKTGFDQMMLIEGYMPKKGYKAIARKVLMVTPLFVALVVIEFTDLLFAVDSIPAIFGVTRDQYVIYTSNVFAIMGLRSMFFVLEAVVHRFEYVGKALAFVLAFIGAKMLIAHFTGFDLPNAVSLGIVGITISASIVASLIKTGGRLEKEAN